jgi:predicted alpha-1,2-mannosidase
MCIRDREYTSADFAIGRFALEACNNEWVQASYKYRSGFWKNIFNPKTNWLQSRRADGSWKNLGEDWREATYKNYFWMVPYDLKELIDTIGGKKVAEARLDDLFRRLDASYNDDWYASGNEPNFQVPWIYNWAGVPYKSQSIIRKILNERFTDKIDGLPGNDDLGAMGSWYVLSSVGLFPVIPGIGGLSINSPVFEKTIIHLPKGNIVITGGSENNPYIQSMKLNGKNYESTWLNWSDIQNGANIEYKLSEKPNLVWGTKVEAPSYK